MNEKQLKHVMGYLAEELVPADVNLWPAIQAQFEKNKKHSQKGDFYVNTNLARHRRNRLVSAFMLAVFVVVALLFATPQGRAWAQEILQFFSRAGSNTLPIQSWQLTPVSTPGTITPDPANILDANQSVEMVEGQAGFHVLEPAWLPGSLAFVGASFEPEHHIARMFYQDVETNGLVLREEPYQRTEDCELCGEVGASATVETVQVDDVSGEYVEGTWKLTDSGPVWESDPYLKTLRWQANGMAFELVYMGPPDSVTKEDMIAVAKSLK